MIDKTPEFRLESFIVSTWAKPCENAAAATVKRIIMQRYLIVGIIGSSAKLTRGDGIIPVGLNDRSLTRIRLVKFKC